MEAIGTATLSMLSSHGKGEYSVFFCVHRKMSMLPTGVSPRSGIRILWQSLSSTFPLG